MFGVQRHITQMPTSGPSLVLITTTRTGTWNNPFSAPTPLSIWTGAANSVVNNATWSGTVVGTLKNVNPITSRDVEFSVTGNSDPQSTVNRWIQFYVGTIVENQTININESFTFNTLTSGALTPRSFLYVSNSTTLQYNLTITLTQLT